MSGYLTRLSGDIRRDAPQPARGFADALAAGAEVTVIAEIKRASPSQGAIAPGADVAETARAYAMGGAAAMSVLCAERDFAGSLGHSVHRPDSGIEIAPASVAIESHGQTAIRPFDANHAGISGTRGLDCVGLHHVIVLLPDPAFAGDVWAGKQTL